MKNRYRVDFYDMFDGWIAKGIPEMPYDYESLEEATKVCKEKNSKLDIQNKKCGEHYGVIDLDKGIEIYCGRIDEHYPRSSTDRASAF